VGRLTNATSYPAHSIFKGTYYFATQTLLGDDFVVETPWLKTSGNYDGSTGSDQDDANLWFQVEEVVKYPIEVYIHKINKIDPIDVSEADWYYGVYVSLDSINWDIEYSPAPIDYDEDMLFVDQSHTFHMDGPLIYVAIVLFEYDGGGSTDDLADISSEPGGGQDDHSGPISPEAYFLCVFDWTTSSLVSGFDVYEQDNNWYYKTSGEFDGSVGIDENDAELWFRIFSMPPKILDWSPKGANVNDASAVGITFGARMDESSVENAFSITPQVPGQFRWNNDSSSFFFIPESLFTCFSSYTVTLTTSAADLNGLHIQAPLSWTFAIESNKDPVSDAGDNQNVEMFELVTFDASGSYDLTGQILSYEWDFGDGVTEQGVRLQHSYFRAKDFNVALTVTDNYGLTSTDTMVVHVEKGNFAPENLVYDYDFFYDFFNENFSTELTFSVSTGVDQLVDLTKLGFGSFSVDSEVLERRYEFVASGSGLTDDNGNTWTTLTTTLIVVERNYLLTTNGFPVRSDVEIFQEFVGTTSTGISLNAWYDRTLIKLTEPISIMLTDSPQSPSQLNLLHFFMVKHSYYHEENGNVIFNAEGITFPYLPFMRKHIIQPLGSKLMVVGEETVKAYGVKHTYEEFDYDVTYDSWFSPHYNVVVYDVNLLLDEGWTETTSWFLDRQQAIPLKELSFEMDDNGMGSPDQSTRTFLSLLTLQKLRDRVDLSDGDNSDNFSTDYETTVRVYEPWAHARFKIGGNQTHEIYLGFDLVYDVILEHEGYAVFNHHVSGNELDRTIKSTLQSTYDEFKLYLHPHFDISMEAWNTQTGELTDVYFYLELPIPTQTDVDGDNSHVYIGSNKVYLWDHPALIWEMTGSNLAGQIHSPQTLSVTIAEIDLLDLIGLISDLICPSCSLFFTVIGWFVGLFIDFNLNIDPQFYYLIGTYSETSAFFGTGENADLQWFGFQSPPGETAVTTGELSLSAALGEDVETSVYRLIKSHADVAVYGSVNFRTVLFPGSIFEIPLFNIPILEGALIEGSSDAYSFTDTYLFHEYTGEDLTPPVSEAHDLPLYSASSFAINADSSDQLSGVKDVKLCYRLDYGTWTEYGTLSNDAITFNTPSDGYYEFYTIATDNWGNIEQAPSVPDASTYVDTTAPNVEAPPSIQTEDPEPTVEWEGSDDTTGIDHYEVSVDHGPFENIGNRTNYTLENLPKGTHQMTIRAYDNSGNYGDTEVEVSLKSSGESGEGQSDLPSVISFEVAIVLVTLIVAISVVLLAAYSNRKKKVR
jgi:hypothetical protein